MQCSGYYADPDINPGLAEKARQAEVAAKQAADETQQLNKKLQIAVEKAESANLAKTNF